MNDGIKVLLCFGLAVSGTGCFFGGGDVVCPDGWNYDDTATYRCAPASAELSEIEEAVGTGSYGWIRSVEGGCGPGDNTCVVTPLVEHTIRFVPEASCSRELVEGPEEALSEFVSATTDERAIYRTTLSPGEYCIVSTDTVTGDRITPAHFTVVEGSVVANDVNYDHGGY